MRCDVSASAMRGAMALLVALAPPLVAQSVRVTGATSVRYIELRPFVRDSVPQATTTGTGLLRQLPDGRIVRCVPGDAFCHDTRPGAVTSTVPVLHDLEVSAWGLGKGVWAYGQVRARSTWGGDAALWPRGDDAFDALAAFVELSRERVRVRAGRQWTVSGLGFYNFDGLTAAVRPIPSLWLEAYGGRSLLRGLNEPRSSGALEAIEPFAPSEAGVLAGMHGRYRPSPRLALGALYQVDFRRDREGIFSELVAADGVLRLGAGSLEAAVEADVDGGALNEARLHARAVPFRRLALFGEARRYRPYFELWTIWGAFSPVGFDEGRGGVTWAGQGGDLLLRGEASYRRYDLPPIDEGADAMRREGWGAGTGIGWSPAPPWRLDASFRVERGLGASRRDASAGVVRRFGDAGSVALQGVFFERLYEFRLAEGTVLGLGTEATLPLSAHTRLVIAAAAYRHLEGGAGSGIDWSQRRGSARLQWAVGAEPGTTTRAGGSR